MIVVALVSDLLFATRIFDAADRAGVTLRRLEAPDELPPPADVSLLLVDWGARQPGWAERIAGWRTQAPPDRRPRVILFGPHTDLEGHAAARAARLGPMWARSKLVGELSGLFVD